MKKILIINYVLLIFVLGIFNITKAYPIRVDGYYKPSTGRYIMPHYRTSPNNIRWDNWSAKGNINPYTGKKGTINPYRINSKILKNLNW